MPSLQFDNQGAGSAGDVHSTQQGGTKLQADMGSAQQWRRRRRRRRGRERVESTQQQIVSADCLASCSLLTYEIFAPPAYQGGRGRLGGGGLREGARVKRNSLHAFYFSW